MKRNIQWQVLFLAVCLSLGGMAKVYAQDGDAKFDRKAFGEKMEARIQAIYDQLGLSDEQKNLLQANKDKHKASKESLRGQLTTNMDAFGEELKKDSVGLGKVNELHAQAKAIRSQMEDERFESILEVRKILTQEQFIKFTQLMQEQREKK